MKKMFFCFGTRPEAIKMASLIADCKNFGFKPIICLSGQHRDMIRPFVEFFNFHVDYDLDVMQENQNLANLTSNILNKTYEVLNSEKPDYVVVQGDTTTTFASALAAFYLKIPVLHIEAGLRTNDIYSPFPEEANRKFVSQISEFHFAPTEMTRENLLNEGITKNVFVTGNTSIDALSMAEKIIKAKGLDIEFSDKYKKWKEDKKLVLVTAHRRENHGEPLQNICDAIIELSNMRKELVFAIPVHLNPNVKEIINDRLGNLENVLLLPPLNYPEFVWFMNESFLIMTDSGGVQEEGPYFKKPILVLRENTERPEGVKAGTNKLIGTKKDTIVSSVINLLDNVSLYKEYINSKNPYGEGDSSKQILSKLN